MESTSRSSSFHDEKVTAGSPTSELDVDTSGIDEAKLVRKIDWHVLPLICIMYLLAFLDRVNVSNAAVFGLQKDLKLNAIQYSNCLVIFFVPYVVFEIPSNYLLKKFKPSTWLSICMFGFGFTTIMQGLVKGYSGFLVTRFFLGLFETGMFPGCFYLLAMWYRRDESQKRFSFFFCSVTLAGAFGGLIATGIGHLDYVHGFRAWRWVFIIEGAVTAGLAILWYFIMPDFPETVKFLTEPERAFVRKRLASDVGASAYEADYSWKNVGGVFKDYKIFLGALMYFGCIVPAYGYAYFAPSIIKGFGFSAIQTQLHSVPPWVAAFGLAMTFAYLSDKTKHRFAFGMIPAVIGMIGYAILLANPHSLHLKYGALFLCVSGVYGAMPVFIGWFNMNLGGHLRRGVGSAFQIGFGNIGGIIASYTFPTTDAPRYIMGYGLSLAFIIVAMASATTYYVACVSQNSARESRIAAGDKSEDGLSPQEKDLRGDLNVEYRYLL